MPGSISSVYLELPRPGPSSVFDPKVKHCPAPSFQEPGLCPDRHHHPRRRHRRQRADFQRRQRRACSSRCRMPSRSRWSAPGSWRRASCRGRCNQSAGDLFHASRQRAVVRGHRPLESGSATITGRGEPEQVETLIVTDGTLPLLGIQPALGRALHQGRRPAERPERRPHVARLLAARVRRQPVGHRPDA